MNGDYDTGSKLKIILEDKSWHSKKMRVKIAIKCPLFKQLCLRAGLRLKTSSEDVFLRASCPSTLLSMLSGFWAGFLSHIYKHTSLACSDNSSMVITEM